MEGQDGPFVYAVHAGSRGGTTDGIGVRDCGGHQYGRRAERLLSRARSWVEHHVDEEDLSVSAMASAMHMSRSTLHRKLVAMTGMAPGAFIRDTRMHLARRLLKEGECNVSEVAYSVGFVSLSGFSRAYRHHYGEAPSSSLHRRER